MLRPGTAIIRHRVAILIATGLVIGAAALALPRLRIDSSSRNLLHVDAKVRATF